MASRRDRLRAAQLAQIEAQAALAEVEKAAPKRKKRSQKAVPPTREPVAPKPRLAKDRGKKSPTRAKGGNRRLKFQAAQKAQLEALPALGEADRALLGPSRRRKAREREPDRPRALRRKAGFQSLLLGQLDAGPVLAEVERELLSLPKEKGALSALGTALARLRVRLTSDGRRARRREAEPEALVVEEAAPEIAEAVAPVKEGLQAPVIEEEPEVDYPAVVVEPEEVEIVTPAATILREMARPYREITTLTAALEDLGAIKQDGFGFVLRFGSAAEDEERESEFEVTGTGLVELSKHLVKWFGEAKDIEEIPLQVIDEGSGELRIFISET